LFTIDIGAIKREDSLFGFNFEVSYDETKLRFDRGIFLNTLSEAFDDLTRDVTLGFEPGTIRGYGVHLNIALPPVFGDKPLVAFLCEFLPDTPDTTSLYINYLEFTEEFKKDVVGYEPIFLQVEYLDKPDRFFNLSFDTTELIFDETDTDKIMLQVSAGAPTRIYDLSMDIVTDDDGFAIEEISAKSDNIIINEVINIQRGVKISASFLNKISEENFLDVTVKDTRIEKRSSALKIENIELNANSCVTRIGKDEVILTSVRDSIEDTVSVAYYYGDDSSIKAWYDAVSDGFIIESKKSLINFASFFDFRGLLVKRIESFLPEERIMINANDISEGIYMIQVFFENGETKNLISIKYK
jgi:hypothetical protein